MRRILCALAVVLAAAPAHAERWPANAYRLDVTNYGAIPDDGLDDAPAINAAIQAFPSKDTTVFLPCGTFDAAGPIEWKTAAGAQTARVSLEGESESCTTLRLIPGSAGYGSAGTPKSFVWTGSFNASGVEAFQNNILDMTIDCRGNAGARCVDFLANNQGSVRDVTILSDGVAGLYLGRAYPGPALAERVTVIGGARCVQMGQNQYSVTFLDLVTQDCVTAGLDFAGNVAFVDGWEHYSATGSPAISASAGGLLVATDARLGCGDTTKKTFAVPSNANYLLRDISVSGCVGGPIGESASQASQGNLAATINIHSQRAPATFYSADFANDWANPLDYGAVNGVGGETNDDTAGIQAAMDSGKPIVYFPKKSTGDRSWFSFKSGTPISIPRTVQRIAMGGVEHTILSSAYQSPTSCVYRIDEGVASDPPLVIEYFRRAGGSTVHPGRYFCITSRRPVVFRRATSILVTADGPGDLYALDNIGSFRISGGRNLYAWQHNSEGKDTPPGTTIAQGPGTIAREFGMKGERDRTGLECSDGARCEVFAFEMPCVGQGAVPVASTGWTSNDAEMTVSSLQYCGGSVSMDKLFPIAVDAEVQIPTSALTNLGGNRRVLPLYSGRNTCPVEP